MNFYSFHIGDYRGATAHLSNEEDITYRRLIDMYYDTEQPIPLDTHWVSRRLRVGSEALQSVLSDFFICCSDGWHNVRCDETISEYHKGAAKNRENGKKGGRPSLKNNPVGSQSVATGIPLATTWKGNQEPITNNQEPVSSTNTPIPPNGGLPAKKRIAAISFPAFIAECKESGKIPIPEDASVFEYADGAGLTRDMLRLQWLEFKDRYSEPGAKKYKAWPSVFCKSVRGNWFKLWFNDKNGNGFVLTTTGTQAENTHRAKQ
jgi:uncharacterized protein YdaU (DUF1376 family)